MRLYYPVWFRLGRLRDERRATTLPGPVFSPTGTRQLRLTHRNRKFADSSLEGTGFEIPVPRYPRWSRGSPRSAIRAEETGRIGARFKSLQERWIRRPRADAVEAFEQLALGVQGFALTAPKGIPIPRSSRCDAPRPLRRSPESAGAPTAPARGRSPLEGEDSNPWSPAAKNSAHTPLSLSHLRERRLRSGCHSLGRFRLLGLPLHRALGEYGFDGLRFGLLFERLHASAHHLKERPAWHGFFTQSRNCAVEST